MAQHEITEPLKENVSSFSAEISNGQAILRWTDPDALDYPKLAEMLVGNVRDFTATVSSASIILKWTDPDDIVYNGKTIVWAGTRIVRKEGGYPADENDGVIVVDSTVRNQYNAEGFVDSNVGGNATYYYQAFPYTIVYNQNEANRAKATLSDAFVTTWNITAGPFSLPTQLGEYNATIDWGDGTTPTTHTSGSPSHKYATAGTYQISITGQYNGFHPIMPYSEKLVSVDNWGNVGFASFGNAFAGCTNLKSLPEGPITGADGVTVFQYCFKNCSSLPSIPKGLFDKCVGATNFCGVFYECTSIATVPDGLFNNSRNIDRIESCFFGCTSLTTIPHGLFDTCQQVKLFYNCFKSCISLNKIPTGLFDNCINALRFDECFASCSSIREIPNGLFMNCPNVDNGYLSVFENCKNLQLPDEIFNLDSISTTKPNFGLCFKVANNADSPTGKVQPIWLYTTRDRSGGAFKNCTALTNYADIPDNWK